MNGRGQSSDQISIDGLHLMYPGTGIALVTAEWIRGLADLRVGPYLSVFIPECVRIERYDLEQTTVHWVVLQKPKARTDYIFRLFWGARVSAKRKNLGMHGPHLIPYLYNYGKLHENTVTIPDLVYRLIPDYGRRDLNKPWWNPRGRLPFRSIARLFEEWSVSRARNLVVYSQFVKDHASDVFRIPDKRFSIVTLAPPKWICEHQTIPKLGVSRLLPKRFALYVGGYALRKNVPMLMQACGRAFQEDATFRCVFAGLTETRIQADAKMAAAWQQPTVKAAIICLPIVDNLEMRQMYEQCSFSLYPSQSEGFGLPVVEAGCCSRLCLCGDNSSLREIQTNPLFRIGADDEPAWVSKILQYWQNPALAEAAGSECKEMSNLFTWKTSARLLLEALLD